MRSLYSRFEEVEKSQFGFLLLAIVHHIPPAPENEAMQLSSPHR
jgi:hypothetical protein